MALIKCPECKKKISNTIKNCPNCGYELLDGDRIIKKKKPILKIVLIGFVLLVVAFFSVLEILGLQDKAKAEKAEQKKQNEFIKDVESYLSCEKDTIEIYKEIVTNKKRVWLNCSLERDDDATDAYTKNSNGKFYKDFNTALNKYNQSSKAIELATNLNNKSESYNTRYNSVDGYKAKKSEYKELKSKVTNINSEFRNLVKYDLDYGYSYDDYDTKTEDYFTKIRELETELESSIKSIK